jgi:transcriptional antiterminator RfaH
MFESCSLDSKRWYAVQTKPKQEARAEANLRRWGVETCLPRLREWRLSRAGEKSCHMTPLFPNYLFAHFDATRLAGKVALTRGIQRVVGFGEYATPIDDAVMTVIRSRIADDGLVRPAELRPGEAVEIVQGPLRSLVGVFERHLHARDRVLILLTTIGCAAHVEVDTAAIRQSTRSVA